MLYFVHEMAAVCLLALALKLSRSTWNALSHST